MKVVLAVIGGKLVHAACPNALSPERHRGIGPQNCREAGATFDLRAPIFDVEAGLR